MILVYDLGGGTFDVSLLAVEDGVFEILATAGDIHLGGEDFDKRVVDYFVDLWQTKYGESITRDSRTMGELKREVEKAKMVLSDEMSVELEIENLFGGKNLSETLSRAKFEEVVQAFRLFFSYLQSGC